MLLAMGVLLVAAGVQEPSSIWLVAIGCLMIVIDHD